MRITTSPSPGRERLVGLVAQAVRAPSSHNTQPWVFAVDDASVDVIADRTRALPVNDPFDRELTISCGAALLMLRCAARAAGMDAHTEVLPDGLHADRIAHVRITAGGEPSIADRQLAAAMARRRTVRGPFTGRPLPDGLPDALRAAGEAEGVAVWPVGHPGDRASLAELVRQGDALQFHDPHWRRELAAWMHPRRRGDGLVVPMGAGTVTRLLITHVDLGGRTGATDAAMVADAQLVVVLSTGGDEPGDWVRAGQALGRMLLVAAAEGVHAGYLNQPCQVASLRPRLQLLGGGPNPQMVLRFGVPDDDGSVRLSPRRPIGDVVERAG